MENDEYFMAEALKEAKEAYLEDEVPVGCVLVNNGKIVARSHNSNKKDGLVTSHAEINVLNQASKILNTYYLSSCTLYVTLEPCFMCSGAIYASKIKRVVYGAKDVNNGAMGGKGDLFLLPKLNHYTLINSGLLEEECSRLLKQYFETKRG